MPPLDFRIDPKDIKIDKVVVAIAAIDAVTGELLQKDIKVSIEGLPDLPRRNLSGMYVFVNLPPKTEYKIKIDAKQAGYFDPKIIKYSPVDDNDPEVGKKRRKDIFLYRRPSSPLEIAATSVAGVLVRPKGEALEPVTFATIRAELPEGIVPGNTPKQFKTFSDERGAFALTLRLPTENINESIAVKIIFEKISDQQVDKRVIEREIKDQVFYSFDKPIDIEGADIPLEGANTNWPELISMTR